MISTLRLEHGKANILDLEFCREIDRRLHEAREASAVILIGTGSIFSAGVDLVRLTNEGASYVEQFVPDPAEPLDHTTVQVGIQCLADSKEQLFLAELQLAAEPRHDRVMVRPGEARVIAAQRDDEIVFVIAAEPDVHRDVMADAEPLTLDALARLRTPSDPQLSPDGRLVAFTVTSVDSTFSGPTSFVSASNARITASYSA